MKTEVNCITVFSNGLVKISRQSMDKKILILNKEYHVVNPQKFVNRIAKIAGVTMAISKNKKYVFFTYRRRGIWNQV